MTMLGGQPGFFEPRDPLRLVFGVYALLRWVSVVKT